MWTPLRFDYRVGVSAGSERKFAGTRLPSSAHWASLGAAALILSLSNSGSAQEGSAQETESNAPVGFNLEALERFRYLRPLSDGARDWAAWGPLSFSATESPLGATFVYQRELGFPSAPKFTLRLLTSHWAARSSLDYGSSFAVQALYSPNPIVEMGLQIEPRRLASFGGAYKTDLALRTFVGAVW